MAALLSSLVPDFQARVAAVIEACARQGVELRPFYALRSPWEQARLWRQSRAREEIDTAIGRLQGLGAPWLAEVLQGVGPCHGRHVTNALPGASWHNWGEAVDCVVIRGGVAVWEASAAAYGVYHDAARAAGLHLGPRWDAVHVQARPMAPNYYHDIADVDRLMRERWERLMNSEPAPAGKVA